MEESELYGIMKYFNEHHEIVTFTPLTFKSEYFEHIEIPVKQTFIIMPPTIECAETLWHSYSFGYPFIAYFGNGIIHCIITHVEFDEFGYINAVQVEGLLIDIK